jgi:hypothetical protein
MQQYYDAVKQKNREDALDAAKHTGVSAGEVGGVYGALNSLLYGAKTIPQVLAKGVGGALSGAAIGAGSSYLGHKLLPRQPGADAPSEAQQGALGGALGGGALGAGGGYLLGSGASAALGKIPGAGMAKKAAAEVLPLDNMITDYIKKKMVNPSHAEGIKTAALLGLLGAGIGGLEGLNTGMDQDLSRSLSEEEGNQNASGAQRSFA